MERTIENELSVMESRMNGLRMSDSQRLVATTAMRNGFLLVDACDRLAQGVAHIGAALFGKPRLAR